MIESLQNKSEFAYVTAKECLRSGITYSDICRIIAGNENDVEAMELELCKARAKKVLDNMRGREE